MRYLQGLWVPEGDRQLIDGLQADVKPKKRPVVDGRVAWRYDRITAALEFIPEDRRRVCVDVGAHIGMWARWLAKHFQIVHAFEPIPRHLACLYPNIIPDYNPVEVHEVALGNHNGETIMVMETEVSGRTHVLVTLDEQLPDITVPIERLDSYELDDVDLIKIDVEGYESEVLFGAEKTIKHNRPVIVIEQLGHEERYGELRNTALGILKDWGMVELRPNMKGDYYMGWG